MAGSQNPQASNPRMEMRGSQALVQNLVMTPQLQQAIKLLQMSNLELQGFVDQELERNPLLERDERTEGQGHATEPAESQPDMVMALASTSGAEERLGTLDTDLDNVYTHEARADAASREAMAGAQDSGWSSLRPGPTASPRRSRSSRHAGPRRAAPRWRQPDP